MLRTILAGAWGAHVGNKIAGNPPPLTGIDILSALLGALVVLLLCDAWDRAVAWRNGGA